MDEKGLKLTHILNTHLHFDHIQGNACLARLTGAPILAGSEDDYLMQTELGRGGMMGFPYTEPFTYQPLKGGEYRFLELDCTVFATPGHSPGSRSFYFPELQWVFVGDLIFYRSVGRTDFPGGDANVLRRSARDCILSLPEETVIYPGHGPETDVVSESLHNSFLVF
ncbi:MAG: MBL fold metallo-hydrolase [Deltaproteobacteria bacterium]|nr:MAG: MBL fold metallo-hydrolase [Deltaproteobacteria bacterium]